MKAVYVDFEAWMAKKFEYECKNLSQIELVATFRTAKAALAYLADHPVDLAFVEMQLPDSDGFSLARRIRALSPKTAVIFFSAYGSETETLLRQHNAREPFVMKPYTGSEVECALAAACCG